MVDCSIGTPCDPPPPAVVEALSASGSERGLSGSVGSPALRRGGGGVAGASLRARVRVAVVGGGLRGHQGIRGLGAQVLRLRQPTRDTVLYPAVSYPTYAMGARLAGCRAVPVPPAPGRASGGSTSAPSPSRTPHGPWCCGPTPRPTRPAGWATWGPRRPGAGPTACPVFSDECYAEFTWDGAAPLRAGARLRRGGGRPLPLQALEPGRRAGRLLRRRPRAGGVPRAGAPPRRPHGARTGAGRGARWPWPTTPMSRCSGRRYRDAWRSWPRCWPGGAARRSCPRVASTCGCRCRRGRWSDGWAMAEDSGPTTAGLLVEPGRPLRRRRRRVRAGRRGAARWTVSSWWRERLLVGSLRGSAGRQHG